MRAAIIQIYFVTGIRSAAAAAAAAGSVWSAGLMQSIAASSDPRAASRGTVREHITARQPRERIDRLSHCASIYFTSNLTIHKMSKSATLMPMCRLRKHSYHHQRKMSLYLTTTHSLFEDFFFF